MNPTCNLPAEKRQDALRQFESSCLDPEEEQTVRELFPQYLFFRNEYEDDGWSVSEKAVRLCTVSCCGETFEGVRANYRRGRIHNEEVTCPYCGQQLTGKAVHKFGYDMKSLESWVKVAVARPGKDGALLVEAGNARRRFNWDNLYGSIDWFPTKRYYFSKDGAAEWADVVPRWMCSPFDNPDTIWTPTKTVGDPFPPNIMGYCDYYGDYQIVGLSEALPRTDLRYCQILEFYRLMCAADLDTDKDRNMVKYLGWYCHHPQIEMAVKIGMVGAVLDLIKDGRKNAKLLNWNATDAAGFLRMSKADAKTFLREELDFTDLMDIRLSRLPVDRYLKLLEQAGGRQEMNELMKCVELAGCTPEQGVRYIRSMQPECARYAVPRMQIIGTWKDYLNMAEQLGYDLREQTVAMPKNLQERHDAAAETVKFHKNEAEAMKYRKRRRQLEKKFAFRMSGLCVLVPAGSEEIVQEGQTLKHCVGGYAPRHIKGSTTILFLRKTRKPGRSFLTMEVEEKNGRTVIRQIHGYMNERYKDAADPRERYAWFLGPWLDWVNSGSERDRDGNPVLPETETITEVKSA